MSQVTAMTTDGPGSKKTCHNPRFNANLKATNAMRMQEGIFLRDLMQAKRWMEKGVRKKNGKGEK